MKEITIGIVGGLLLAVPWLSLYYFVVWLFPR